MPLLAMQVKSEGGSHAKTEISEGTFEGSHAIEHLLTRPVGRPSKAPKVFYENFTYQAKSWDQARRVAAKVE